MAKCDLIGVHMCPDQAMFPTLHTTTQDIKPGEVLIHDEPLGVKLHSTMDAAIWAKEFCRIFREKQVEIDDEFEDYMRGWFANAIMCGWDIAHQRMKEPGASCGEA